MNTLLEALLEAIRRITGWSLAAVFTGVLLIAGVHPPMPATPPELQRKVAELEGELHTLKRENQMPVLILNRHRQSICFIYGVYSFIGPNTGRRAEHTNFSGTGFVVRDGLLATNRHVVEPWFEDEQAEDLIRHGARPRIEKLVAFFPDHRNPVDLTDVTVSPDADVAVARFTLKDAPEVAPLPLAHAPAVAGDPVIVVGYPMGITAMVAKSPRPVYRRLAYRRADMAVARELAALSLIRPSATQGHLGDVVGDKLIYDAVTAHGGSGGPVFNNRGEVVGVNSAYLDGFSGGTLGISVNALLPVMAAAREKH